jgi:transitional endoplasmic reticulum ATPase
VVDSAHPEGGDSERPSIRGGMLFRVIDALLETDRQATAWMHPADMKIMGLEPGDVVRVTGRQAAVATVSFVPTNTGERVLMLDVTTRRSAGVQIGEGVRLEKVGCGTAMSVRLARILAQGQRIEPRDGAALAGALAGIPVQKGIVLRDPFGGFEPAYRVASTVPDGPVRIIPRTQITFVEHEVVRQRPRGLTYAEIGGLDRELERIREIVELPLRFPRLFRHLGITPPKGILLHGPPGTGKTLIARVLAAESNSYFIHVNGPEVVQKYYGESEARLREIFDQAEHHAPSIIFIDEIDAIAPRRSDVSGEVEKRLVAQFLALLDGFETRGQVIVLGATNLLENIDPALRRPGRFDKEIEIGVPNSEGRRRILEIHTRTLPLDPTVSLEEVAARTTGFVGADLAALCQDAAMESLRGFLGTHPPILAGDEPSPSDLTITGDDFLAALRQIEPSATREMILERPAVRFADVGGLPYAKEALTAWVTPGVERPGHGLMLTGPPGSGKSYLVRALAGEIDLPLIEVEASTLYSKWQGESERALAELFVRARRASPCVLFFDNIDALAPVRKGVETASQHRMLAQLLREIDRLSQTPELILAAATNRIDLLDPALLRAGRFDYLIEIQPLAPEERRDVLAICVRGMPLARDADLSRLAEGSDGLTAADLAAACRRALALARQDARSGRRESRIRPEHFRQAFEAARQVAERRAGPG